MTHPLSGADVRISRADIHLDELMIVEEELWRTKTYRLFADHDPQTDNITYGLKQRRPFPDEYAALIGEITYNLRAALDYLVYELALNDSGAAQDGTQFPIEDFKLKVLKHGRKVGFDTRIKTWLKGLSPPHIDAIEQLQPYKGVDWTKTLREISNPDKHRKLTATITHFDSTFQMLGGEPGSFAGRPGKILSGVGPDGIDVYVEGEATVDILFPDGDAPVVETLEILKGKVAETIDSFKPEFKV